MGKQRSETPWQALEKQAYHAYREWPIWLMLRGRELSARMANTQPQPASPTTENFREKLGRKQPKVESEETS